MRFESLLYITQKDFHYIYTGPYTKGTSTEKFAISDLEYITSLSNTTPLLKRQGTKPKLNLLYTRGMGTNKQQSPLYKRDKVQSQTTTTIISTQER